MSRYATPLLARAGPIVLSTAGAALPALGTAAVILAVGGAVTRALVGWGLGCRLATPAPVEVTLPVALRRDGTMDPAEG
jgi:hypothetical protein